MKTIGSTDKTRLHAEEIKKMETAIEAANEYIDGNQELADVDEYKKEWSVWLRRLLVIEGMGQVMKSDGIGPRVWAKPVDIVVKWASCYSVDNTNAVAFHGREKQK
ncbi:hypothetical protein R6Q59_027187 [Mikania micrantha]